MKKLLRPAILIPATFGFLFNVFINIITEYVLVAGKTAVSLFFALSAILLLAALYYWTRTHPTETIFRPPSPSTTPSTANATPGAASSPSSLSTPPSATTLPPPSPPPSALVFGLGCIWGTVDEVEVYHYQNGSYYPVISISHDLRR